jgi:hypothetical protein
MPGQDHHLFFFLMIYKVVQKKGTMDIERAMRSIRFVTNDSCNDVTV